MLEPILPAHTSAIITGPISRMMLMHLIDSSGNYEIAEAEDGADAWQQLVGGLRPAA